MSLLSSATLQRARSQLPGELWVCLFHSTPPHQGGKRSTKVASQGPSRTRLVKDLTPKSNPKSQDSGKGKGRLVVAKSFDREPAPHTGVKDLRAATLRPVERQGRRGEERSPKSNFAMSRRPRPLAASLRLSGSAETGRPVGPKQTPRVINPLSPDFELNTKSVSTDHLPTEFTSPPLIEGLLSSVNDVLGPNARPTPIQALSLKHIVDQARSPGENNGWVQYLLASETGSGKSIAYFLPVLQDLKKSELNREEASQPGQDAKLQTAINPRALVLAPTHELSRQLSGFAKSLIHNIRLRILCASRANTPSTARRNVTASKMASTFAEPEDVGGEFEVSRSGKVARPVDILVGTPSKVLELVRGHGWDWEANKEENVEDTWDVDEKGRRIRPRRAFIVGQPEVGLKNVEWVVIDEADVLFDPDFQESTRLLLSDIASARGHAVPYSPELILPASNPTSSEAPVTPEVPQYPFNLLLTTATIPSYLASYLDTYHPSLTRLASPRLHKLPSTLQTEYESWTGGRKNKDIERRIRKVWWEDSVASGKVNASADPEESNSKGLTKSKILVFCNKSSKVEDLGKYLEEQGIPNVALTSTSDSRRRGNNHHLDGFLRSTSAQSEASTTSGDSEDPHVLITTSLLSRGLDFAPSIKHVFIVDSPRNMVDFLHRAGRSGRAGEQGSVVVFGKEKGRGADKDRDVRRRVGALAV